MTVRRRFRNPERGGHVVVFLGAAREERGRVAVGADADEACSRSGSVGDGAPPDVGAGLIVRGWGNVGDAGNAGEAEGAAHHAFG